MQRNTRETNSSATQEKQAHEDGMHESQGATACNTQHAMARSKEVNSQATSQLYTCRRATSQECGLQASTQLMHTTAWQHASHNEQPRKAPAVAHVYFFCMAVCSIMPCPPIYMHYMPCPPIYMPCPHYSPCRPVTGSSLGVPTAPPLPAPVPVVPVFCNTCMPVSQPSQPCHWFQPWCASTSHCHANTIKAQAGLSLAPNVV